MEDQNVLPFVRGIIELKTRNRELSVLPLLDKTRKFVKMMTGVQPSFLPGKVEEPSYEAVDSPSASVIEPEEHTY